MACSYNRFELLVGGTITGRDDPTRPLEVLGVTGCRPPTVCDPVDGVTGWLDYIQTDKGSTVLQNQSYSWDRVGNLMQRKDWKNAGNPTEVFAYDSLDRLKSSSAPKVGNGPDVG